MTLRPFIDNYLLVCRFEGLPLFAVAVYRKVLEDFLEVNGDMKVSDLRPAHVKDYLASLGDNNARQASGIMRMFCHWLFAQNNLRYVPTQPRRPSQLFPRTSKVQRSWVV